MVVAQGLKGPPKKLRNVSTVQHVASERNFSMNLELT